MGIRLLPWEYGVRNLFRRPLRSALTALALDLDTRNPFRLPQPEPTAAALPVYQPAARSRSLGDWFEIRSKHGNPRGYVRIDDVSPMGRSNY